MPAASGISIKGSDSFLKDCRGAPGFRTHISLKLCRLPRGGCLSQAHMRKRDGASWTRPAWARLVRARASARKEGPAGKAAARRRGRLRRSRPRRRGAPSGRCSNQAGPGAEEERPHGIGAAGPGNGGGGGVACCLSRRVRSECSCRRRQLVIPSCRARVRRRRRRALAGWKGSTPGSTADPATARHRSRAQTHARKARAHTHSRRDRQSGLRNGLTQPIQRMFTVQVGNDMRRLRRAAFSRGGRLARVDCEAAPLLPPSPWRCQSSRQTVTGLRPRTARSRASCQSTPMEMAGWITAAAACPAHLRLAAKKTLASYPRTRSAPAATASPPPFGGPRDEAHRQDFIIAGRGPTRHIGRQRE